MPGDVEDAGVSVGNSADTCTRFVGDGRVRSRASSVALTAGLARGYPDCPTHPDGTQTRIARFALVPAGTAVGSTVPLATTAALVQSQAFASIRPLRLEKMPRSVLPAGHCRSGHLQPQL